MYADTISDAMDEAIKETSRRRTIQEKYNKDHGIIPQTIIKSIKDIPTTDEENKEGKKMSKQSKKEMLIKIENEMKEAAKALDFEKAMELRDILFELKEKK
jgi:excinuclease ABC subunit B